MKTPTIKEIKFTNNRLDSSFFKSDPAANIWLCVSGVLKAFPELPVDTTEFTALFSLRLFTGSTRVLVSNFEEYPKLLVIAGKPFAPCTDDFLAIKKLTGATKRFYVKIK